MREYKIQKTTGGVVHAGSWHGNESDPRNSRYGYFTPSCGSGVVYAASTLRNVAAFRELPQDTKVTCKKCLKMIQKAEDLGLHLKVVENEDGSSKVVDTRKEDTTQHETEAKAPTATTVADQIAQIRANREAEEEERAAARRARNRVNYAPAPAAREETSEEAPEIKPEPAKAQPFTYHYDATTGILIADAMREKAKYHRTIAAEYRKAKGQLMDFYAEQARIADNNAELLEREADKIHAPVKGRLSEEMGRALDRAMEKPFHRQVKDAIDLKW